jgi:peptide deformylase
MLKLRFIGDPILRRETEPVKVFDQSLKDFTKSMIKTMHKEDGIGLAAPQIGYSKKVLVVDISGIHEDEKPRVFINPEIIHTSGEAIVEEGCLSIPEVREDVERPEKIKLKYSDENGDSFEEEYDEWMARVLQHEIDHLNGVLFVDLISPVKRILLTSQKMIPEKY